MFGAMKLGAQILSRQLEQVGSKPQTLPSKFGSLQKKTENCDLV